MKATLTYHNKGLSTNGDITEIKIWKVPVTPDKPHTDSNTLLYLYMRTNGSSVTITPNKKGIIVISAIRN